MLTAHSRAHIESLDWLNIGQEGIQKTLVLFNDEALLFLKKANVFVAWSNWTNRKSNSIDVMIWATELLVNGFLGNTVTELALDIDDQEACAHIISMILKNADEIFDLCTEGKRNKSDKNIDSHYEDLRNQFYFLADIFLSED